MTNFMEFLLFTNSSNLIGRRLSQINTDNYFQMISNLVGRLDRPSRCPGKRAGAEAKKGREQTFPFSILFPFRKETRGERDGLTANGGSPQRERRNPCLFWRGECFFARAWDPLAIGNFFYLKNPLKI